MIEQSTLVEPYQVLTKRPRMVKTRRPSALMRNSADLTSDLRDSIIELACEIADRKEQNRLMSWATRLGDLREAMFGLAAHYAERERRTL